MRKTNSTSTIRLVALAAAVVSAIAVAPRRAHAQADVRLQAKEYSGPPKDDGMNYPSIEATVINAANQTPDKITLVQKDAKVDGKSMEIPIKATAVKTYVQGNEPVNIAVLIEGHGLYMGDPEVADAGVFKAIGPALDALTNAGPPGSKGEVVIYGNAPLVKLPMGDLKNLTGAALGNQKDYLSVTARELKAGVDQAFGDLNKMPGRKVLIIIGDGADTNPDNKAALAALKKENEAKNHIEVWAVFYDVGDPNLEPDQSVVKALAGGNIKTAGSKQDIAAAVTSIVSTQIQNRYYVTFPGFDDKLKTGFTWDGQPHQFSLKIGDDEVDVSDPLLMKPEWHLPVHKKFPWLWVILGGIVGLVLLLVVIAKVAGGKKVAAPPPMVVQQPIAAPVAPPPAAPSPMKTMMVNINAGDDGWPIVGWLVPLNGPNQFQTFKLTTNTVIGTGGGAHVVVNDGFMSTEHAMIVGTSSGFILKDKGSTNGCLVNERRVTEHSLIDNDVILMGKTNFKFKTTGE